MQLDWWTLGLQALNFLVLVWLLQRFLYRPVMRVIERRRQESVQALIDAEAQARAAAEHESQLREARARLQAEQQTLLDRAREDAAKERQHLVDEAQKTAQEQVAAGRAELARETALLQRDLRERAAALAVEMTGTLLRRAASSEVAESFLAQIDGQLAAMSARERAKLFGPGDGGGAVVASVAPELDEAARSRWQQRLGRRLGNEASLSFAHEPKLIAGVRLRFPAAILELSWRDVLQAAQQELTADEPAA